MRERNLPVVVGIIIEARATARPGGLLPVLRRLLQDSAEGKRQHGRRERKRQRGRRRAWARQLLSLQLQAGVDELGCSIVVRSSWTARRERSFQLVQVFTETKLQHRCK